MGIAALFAEVGNVVGFDGSEVRFLTPEVAVLRGVAGMVSPGQTALHPGVNAIQTLVAARHAGGWQIELFQNTPAAFHGRPELSAALTEELSQLLAKGG